MKKLLKILFSFLIFSFFLVPQAKAADLNINCPAPAACSKTGVDPFFSNSLDGFWYPGKSITKTINLKNSGPETREMAIKGTRTSTANILENVMHITIVGGTAVIWSGSVADFYGQDKIGMGIFESGANLDYNFAVFMSSDADDNYQNKETVFDLTLGFWSAPGGGGGGGETGDGLSDGRSDGMSSPTLANVLGTSSIAYGGTESALTPTPTPGEILGIKNQTSSNKSLPYIFLIFQLIFALFFFFLVLSFYTGAPFVPSRAKSAKRMIELAHISKGIRVYDLGSGDGKLLFLAASCGAIATGFEINPFLVLFTNVKALFYPHGTHVHAFWKNFWNADLSNADVILLYLIPWRMEKLEQKLLKETKPKTRIISNSFIFSNIPCTEKDIDNHIYGFTVPKKRV